MTETKLRFMEQVMSQLQMPISKSYPVTYNISKHLTGSTIKEAFETSKCLLWLQIEDQYKLFQKQAYHLDSKLPDKHQHYFTT